MIERQLSEIELEMTLQLRWRCCEESLFSHDYLKSRHEIEKTTSVETMSEKRLMKWTEGILPELQASDSQKHMCPCPSLSSIQT